MLNVLKETIKLEAEQEMNLALTNNTEDLAFAINYLLANKNDWKVDVEKQTVLIEIDFNNEKAERKYKVHWTSLKVLGTNVDRYFCRPYFGFYLIYTLGLGLTVSFYEGGYGDDCKLEVTYKKSNPKTFKGGEHYFSSNDPYIERHRVKNPENIVTILRLTLQ